MILSEKIGILYTLEKKGKVMERILQSFKNLYKGETPFKNHMWFVLMLLIPSFFAGVVNYIDKETPKEMLIILGVVALVFGILSVIPSVFLAGYSVDFCQNRLNNGVGFPKISWDLFIKGAKLIPLGFVWSIYALIFFGIFFLLPLFLLAFNSIITGPVATGDKTAGFLIFMLGFLFIMLFLCVIAFLITPFLSYVTVTYVNDGGYSAKLFNPLIIIDFMKKSFKSTIMVALKYILVSLVIGMAVSIIYIALLIIYVGIMAVIAIASPTITLENVAYAPITLLFVIPLFGIGGVFQMYVNSIIGYAQLDNYIEIFKKEINL